MKRLPDLMPDFPRADIAGQLGMAPDASNVTEHWTDGTVSIPKGGTAARIDYDRRFREAIEARYGGTRISFTSISVEVTALTLTNSVVNRPRYEMYKEMLRAGDEVPPLLVKDLGSGVMNVIDGNHRTQAAIDTPTIRLSALLWEQKPEEK